MTVVYTAIARAVYGLLALLVVPLCLLSLSSWFTNAPARTGTDFLNMLLWPSLMLLVYLPPSVRGWWRVLRREDLVPRTRWAERPVVATIVVLSSALTLALVALIATVLRDAFTHGYDELDPLGGLMLLAAMSAAIAVLTCEWVLVGRDD